MLWRLEGSSPVYLQLMAHIRRAVLQGEYPPGARIEPVRELAAKANVNPNTMQRALTALEAEGLLVTCGTAGRFVTSDRAVLDAMRTSAVDAAIRESAGQFKALGLSLKEAAQLLLELEKEEAI